MREREQFPQDVAQHFCLSACHEEIEEFQKGLDILGLVSVLQSHYEESKTELFFSHASSQLPTSCHCLKCLITLTKMMQIKM